MLPPIGKQKRYSALTSTVIYATERGKVTDRPAIEWKLITDLPVATRAAAIEDPRWYGQPWKIEVFHKILKSGCRAEDARFRTAERLVRLNAVFCILGWRVFWMTMKRRVAPDAIPKLIPTHVQIGLLDRLISDNTTSSVTAGTLAA